MSNAPRPAAAALLRPLLRAALVLITLQSASAHHPGERLDETMETREPAFEATDTFELPPLALRRPDGTPLALSDLRDRIVVIAFAPPACGAPCERLLTQLASAQASINLTPMRDVVTFVVVAPPSAAPADRFDAANAVAAAPADGASTAELAIRLGALSRSGGAAPMAHVIDRAARHAGIFHGAGFEPLNMVLYVNGLSNAPPAAPAQR